MDDFNDKVKEVFTRLGKKRPWGGSCAITLIEAMQELGFQTIPEWLPVGVPRKQQKTNNIDLIIHYLIKIAQKHPSLCQIIGNPLNHCSYIPYNLKPAHKEAQRLANENTGDYFLIAATANYRELEPRKLYGNHHITTVVSGKLYNGAPLCAGGGMANTDFIVSHAHIHFRWGWVYGKKVRHKKAPLISTKERMIYFKYMLKK